MLRRWLTHVRLCFRTQSRKELRGHHLRGALDHSLAHARNRPAYLNVAHITHLRSMFCLSQIEIARTFEKSRRAFTVNYDSKMFGLPQILETRGPVEDSFYRPNAGADRCSKSILSSFFQSLTTGNAALQNLPVNERLIDAFSRRLEFVSAFQFHLTLALAA